MLRHSASDRAIINAGRNIQRKARQEATRARPKSPKADRGRERNPGFLAYLRRQRCIPNSAAAGVKNHDRHATPLCAGHHSAQHDRGDERAWWSSIGKDAYATAASHFAAYQGAGE